jgi:serine protease Do
MRARLPFLLMITLAVSSLHAQIRDFVPVVRPKFHDDTVAFLEKLSDSMQKDGYYDAADMLKYYAKGGFGSGFVYVAKDGTNYVITNLHVVSQAASVTLEFQQKEGGKTMYENCSVLAVDEKLDLALVAFPDGVKPFKVGLAFSDTTVEDGGEVWSAGYPGLGDTPAWQLGKGNITNAQARIPELADPDLTFIIQHSAQVDPGNSGGPLLLVDKASPAGYTVIGINTWKAVNRQAANFSIPSKAIQVFLKKALTPEAVKANQASLLESRCRAFAKTTGKRTEAYKDLAPYVSYAYVGVVGESALKDVLATAPTKIRDDVLDVFVERSPIEGIRLAIAYTILAKIPEGETSGLSFTAIDGEAEEAKARVPVRFSLDGKEVATAWVREHGLWRLADYSGLVKAGTDKDAKKKGDATASSISFDECPYDGMVYVGALMPTDDLKIWVFGVEFIPSNYYSFNAELGAANFFDSMSMDSSSSGIGAVMEMGAGAKAFLPITWGSFCLMPYVGVDGGVLALMDQEEVSTYFAADGGVRVGFNAVNIGVSYRYYFSHPVSFDYDSALFVYAALGF